MALVVVLALAVLPSKVDVSFHQINNSSLTELTEHSNSFGIFVNINQAANFNHISQATIDYVFVVLIALFIVLTVNYQWFKPTISPHPWYITLRYKSRKYISGFKISNLQYTTELTYQH